jgi:hypothetical protein
VEKERNGGSEDPPVRLGFNCDLSSFCRFSFGQNHFEHAIFECRADFIRFNIRRQHEAAGEGSIETLNPMVFSLIHFFKLLPFTPDGQRIVAGKLNVEVIPIQTGKIEMNLQMIFCLTNIRSGHPAL